MTDPFDGFGSLYVTALEAFLRAGDETSLSRAYELGRQAMIKGLGVLDMANLHHAALGVLVVAMSPTEQIKFGQTSAEFFAELLSPFEMSFRGYRAANEELQRLNESLRQQKEAVEIANRDLEAFSYSVSHDLRAPLRTIAAYSEFVLEDCAGALGDQSTRHLQRIHDTARDMGVLIDSLLSLARVTRTEIRRAEVDLTELARQVAELLRATAPHRTVSIVVEDNVHAEGDAGLLRVVLENLLGNAWKFTAKRAVGEIRFGCVPGDGPPTYFVRDNGAGFDMAAASKLFAPFQRLHAASEFEGTGIGLATVQRVIERHHGRVWAESAIDQGTTFFFTLGEGH
jgi:light-regulated signal transduction histidine kinase (bacteriophytochrome)